MSTNYRQTRAKVACSTAETLQAAAALHRRRIFLNLAWTFGLLMPLAIAVATGVHFDAASLAVGVLVGMAVVWGLGALTAYRQLAALRIRARAMPQRFEAEMHLDEEGFTVHRDGSSIRFPWSDVTRTQESPEAMILITQDGRFVALPAGQLDGPTRQFVTKMIRSPRSGVSR